MGQVSSGVLFARFLLLIRINHKSGKKYIGPVPLERKGQSGAWGRDIAPIEHDPVKLGGARGFKNVLDRVKADPDYARLRAQHEETY
ncbi:MAG: DUF4385 family protein [Pyrinomonadaceae bacterium]